MYQLGTKEGVFEKRHAISEFDISCKQTFAPIINDKCEELLDLLFRFCGWDTYKRRSRACSRVMSFYYQIYKKDNIERK